jgi:hypothetical protein
MSEDNKKRIQIKSNFVSNTAAFYERIEDPTKGSVKVRENQTPMIMSSNRTVETRPYKNEAKVHSDSTNIKTTTTNLNQKKPGYDTSEL